MALPEQLRKQTEAVNEHYDQLNTEATQGEGKPQADGVGKSTDVSNNVTTADENVTSKIAAQSTDVESESVGTSNEEDPPSESFVQKYKTLQGMYNAEVPRLHSQNRELQSRVQQMEQLLATMSAQPQADKTQEASKSYVTDEDLSEYGESIDVMRRVSREEVTHVMQKMGQIEQLLNQMQSSVVPQVQSLTHKQAMSTEQQFWSDLSGAVPNWRDINNDPDFQTWLLDVDPFTGSPRQTLLEDAQRNFDVRRISNFFNTWSSNTGQVNAAQNSQRKSSSELEKQVAPGRSRSAAAPTGGNSRTYAPSDIEEFFSDVRKGKYKGREEERSRVERDIFAAQRDGRIIANA